MTIAAVISRSRAAFLLAAALACAFAAVTLSAAENADENPSENKKNKRKITEPTGTLEGYFVRVKSGVSGEKELYYNKDGTLRSASGDGLLDGNFSLDESLLGDDGDDAAFDFAPGTDAPDDAAAGGNAPKNVPETASPHGKNARAADAVPAEKNVPAKATSADGAKISFPEKNAPEAASEAVPAADDDAEEGSVDEFSILRKYSRKKNDFGLTENYKNVIGATAAERYKKSYSLKDWQNAAGYGYGMRRWMSARDDDNYGMRTAEFRPEKSGANVPAGLFDTRSERAGERMFVRNGESTLEVRLNERFSSQNVRTAERARVLRESSGFSMQDINRYQFRRNRPSIDGLPVISPGGDGEVQMRKIGGKSTPGNGDGNDSGGNDAVRGNVSGSGSDDGNAGASKQ